MVVNKPSPWGCIRTAANCSCKSGIGSSGLDLIKPPESVGVKTKSLSNSIFLKSFSVSNDNEVVNVRSEEHTSELQSRPHLVCRLLLEKKKKTTQKSKQY